MRYVFLVLSGWLVGLLLPATSTAQLRTMAQVDSLRLLLRTNPADTNRVGALLRLSGHYQGRTLNYHHNLDTALVLANQAQALSQQLNYAKGQQEALVQQGRVFIKQEKLGKVKRMLLSLNEITRIRLLLELGKNKLRPSYSQEANLDSALFYFNQAEQVCKRSSNQYWQQESQIMKGVTYLIKQDCKTGQAWFMRVIDARQRANDQAGELRAWLRLLTTKDCESVCVGDSTEFTKALTLARQLNDKPTELLLLLQRVDQAIMLGDLKKAERIALQALSFQKAINYPVYNQAFHTLVDQNDYLQRQYLFNLLDAHCLLSDIHFLNNNLAKGIFYNLEVIKKLEHSGLRQDLDWPYFWLGNTYFDQGKYAKGLTYYQQSLAVSHQKGEVVVYVGLIRRMAESLIREGKARQALKLLNNFTSQQQPLDYTNKISIAIGFGQCYMALGQYNIAEQHYLESVARSSKTGDLVNNFVFSYIHISAFYVATAQYVKAAPYLRRMLTFKKKYLCSPDQKMQLYQLQFKTDSAQANYPSAIRYYQQYTSLKDSLFNEKSSQQMAELDIKYQTRQNEQALQLRQKDITLLTQQSKTQQTQRNALIGGTLLLAALLGLGYNRYRLKQQSNQLLQEQQQEIFHKNKDLQRLLGEQEQLLEEQERLLKEIHHRVKNNLQIVMSLLNSQAASLNDPTALAAIQQSLHRVQAMALIHQKLYQTQGVARIPMVDYIAELVAYLH